MNKLRYLLSGLLAVSIAWCSPSNGVAQPVTGCAASGFQDEAAARGCVAGETLDYGLGRTAANVSSWIHPDVEHAWSMGYFGQGSRITVVDDFTSYSYIPADLGYGRAWRRHGEWVGQQAAIIAPEARINHVDWYEQGWLLFPRNSLNVINLSYGLFAPPYARRAGWTLQDYSIVFNARRNNALVVKAAGNDAAAVGSVIGRRVDQLSLSLIGLDSAIFVGALDGHGSATSPTSLASYSNYPGSNSTVQQQFITVGVLGDRTGLYGTSFAAPVISGYAAILGSKFSDASPVQIADQLLGTARTDTIFGYNPALHGAGEASLSRALAPASIR